MQPVPSAGKHATDGKRGKTRNWCQAQENMQPMPSAGKQATDAKRGKTCNWCQAQENKQPFPSAGNRRPLQTFFTNFTTFRILNTF